jgi:hypothetical protein
VCAAPLAANTRKRAPLAPSAARAGGTTLTAFQSGSQVWASEVCATFFQNCGGSPPTTINVSVTLDSLRVCVAPSLPSLLPPATTPRPPRQMLRSRPPLPPRAATS